MPGKSNFFFLYTSVFIYLYIFFVADIGFHTLQVYIASSGRDVTFVGALSRENHSSTRVAFHIWLKNLNEIKNGSVLIRVKPVERGLDKVTVHSSVKVKGY